MLTTITRALCAVITAPFHALAAARATTAFSGFGYDPHELTDDDELLDDD